MIEFADVEALLVSHLSTVLTALGDSAGVSTKRTTDSPDRLVRITRTGGWRTTVVEDRPQVTFECWDATDPDAASLSALVRSEIQAMDSVLIDGSWVSWVDEIGGPTYFPHPDTAIPRYQHTQLMAVIGFEVRQGD